MEKLDGHLTHLRKPQWISYEEFKEITINTEKPRTVWVAIIEVKISQLEGQRKIAIVTDISRGRGSLAPRVLMNAPFFEDADDIDERPWRVCLGGHSLARREASPLGSSAALKDTASHAPKVVL